MVKICIFERSNEKSHFSKTKINFLKKSTPQLLEHIGLQNMKVGEKKVKVKIVNQQEKKEKTFQVKKKTSSD